MKRKYAQHFGTATPQYRRIPEAEQIQNRAGGWAFPITDQIQAERFLVLGTAESTYYASARELTREAASCIDRLLESGHGEWLVATIADISESGRAPKNDAAIFALAMCIKLGDVETRRHAADVLPRVVRTGTHLAQYVEALKVFSARGPGWGRVVKRSVSNWLDSKTDDQLAYQMVKYRQREGWTWRDILRKLKPTTADGRRDDLYRWAVGKHQMPADMDRQPPDIIQAFEAVQTAEHAIEVVNLIKAYRLPWEAVPSKWARDLEVQEALFESMPIGASIRQLGRLTSIGLIMPGSLAMQIAVRRITDKTALKHGRIHPMNLYIAEEVYAVGRGIRGGMSWKPVPAIIDALGRAYIDSFSNVEPSGKSIVVAVDTSASMQHGGVMGLDSFRLTEAAFISAYTQMRIEKDVKAVTFSTYAAPFTITGEAETLREVKQWARQQLGIGGGTDCSSPIMYAHQNWPDVDGFCIYTDNETWFGSIHPIEALWKYREKWGRKTKLVSQAFVANAYSIQPVDDAESLAVIGMDDNAPQIITDFLRS